MIKFWDADNHQVAKHKLMKGYYYYFLVFICYLMLSSNCKEENLSKDQDQNTLFQIPEGFELEDLYTPSKSGHGSWVSLTKAPDSIMYACDQFGGLYKFKIPAIGRVIDSLDIDSVELNIGYAQGLLWAFNSLYVVVSRSYDEEDIDKPTSGIYRLKDLDQDGKLDQIDKILEMKADGEHGPHTLRISPDGKSLYFIAGNFNKVPDHFTSRLPKNWREDNLLPPYLDARGHANNLTAPGAWIAKADPDGQAWEIIGAGMRNPFSFGFNADGELFAYDADMEWDFGMPWYRPTRILHITSGSEYGWRTGSGKWPVFYPDNLPAVVNMAQGSPTAVIMGKDLRFPPKYKTGLFACDWSFGTIYFVDIEAQGSSYTGKREEFLSGTPLPISNAIAGSDGHLYFITGGRSLESHLYRLRYKNPEIKSTPSLVDSDAKSLRDIRKKIESYHQPTKNPRAITEAWKYLDHTDEFIRYAARIAIEHQLLSDWTGKLMQETKVDKILQASLSYARSDGELDDSILNKLNALEWSNLSSDQKIILLRSYEILLSRNESISKNKKDKIRMHISSHFPSDSHEINKILSQLLIYLNDGKAVEKSMALLISESTLNRGTSDDYLSSESLARSEKYGPKIKEMLEHMPPIEALHYVTVLSHATEGWTDVLREEYFDWFYEALSKKGGESYKAFLDNIRAKALSHVPKDNKEYYQNKSGFYSPLQTMAKLPEAKGPGKHYTLMDLGALFLWNEESLKADYHGTVMEGRRAYQAAQCETCHRMRGEGGASGPDLTNIATRFKKSEIAEAILSPNEVISDQYAFSIISLKEKNIVGRIVEEKSEAYKLYQSPYAPNQLTEINKSEVLKVRPSPISPMPAQLLNSLNEQEIKDLFVYLLAGGNNSSEYYQNGAD